MNTIHASLWIILFLFHTVFLLRSQVILSRNELPRKFDRFLMGGSQLLLIPAIISTAILVRKLPAPHIFCCIMPPVMMFLMARRSFRRRHPMLLPLANEIWIAAAVITIFVL